MLQMRKSLNGGTIMGVPPRLFKQSIELPGGSGRSVELAKQGRLLTAGALLGFDRGNRGHVEDAAGGYRWGEDMRRARRADQDRPNRKCISQGLDHLIGDVGGVEIWHDQDIGLTFQL